MTEQHEHRRGRRSRARAGASGSSFEINRSLDLDRLRDVLRTKRRLHITELLDPTAAESLYHALARDVEWSTLLAANGRMYEAPHGVQRAYGDEQARALIDLAHRSARERGFGYAYDAHALRAAGADAAGPSLLDRFAEFVSSPEFTGIISRICGMEEIARIELQAVRLRPGHFMTFHHTLLGGDKECQCRAFFSYSVTPEWRPEWGGLLELRGEEGHLVEAYAPCFNCLDIFALPQGRWLSTVSPIAGAPAYSVSGSVYGRMT